MFIFRTVTNDTIGISALQWVITLAYHYLHFLIKKGGRFLWAWT